VPLKQAGSSLVDYLAFRFPYKLREEWERMILDGKIAVNGEPGRPDRVLRQGDMVAYEVVLKEPPVDATISVIHDELTFVVAAKSGQLPSHADGNFVTHTFIHILTERLRAGGWTGLVRLVHRLDRETSGVMVVAKDGVAHANLMRQFQDGTIGKEYLAIAKGRSDQERFEVGGPIGRAPASQISVRQALVPAGTRGARDSLTRFERVRELRDATLLRCIPATGRTNQIRVHLESAGHPVVGDKLYGKTDEEFLAFIRHVKAGGDPVYAGRAEVPRHLLHASKLSFDHPVTGARLTFEAPMPEDMQSYVESNGPTAEG